MSDSKRAKRKPAKKPATERQKFEKYISRKWGSEDFRRIGAVYQNTDTDLLWCGWQARARLARREGK